MEYTVDLLEKERDKLFEKAKKLSNLIEVHSRLGNEYMNEYKDLDDKICELDHVLHQIKKPS